MRAAFSSGLRTRTGLTSALAIRQSARLLCRLSAAGIFTPLLKASPPALSIAIASTMKRNDPIPHRDINHEASTGHHKSQTIGFAGTIPDGEDCHLNGTSCTSSMWAHSHRKEPLTA